MYANSTTRKKSARSKKDHENPSLPNTTNHTAPNLTASYHRHDLMNSSMEESCYSSSSHHSAAFSTPNLTHAHANCSALDGVWEVDESALKFASKYYWTKNSHPSSSTCISVQDGSVDSVSEVAQRIVRCLKEHSIQARYTSNVHTHVRTSSLSASKSTEEGGLGNSSKQRRHIVPPPKASCVTMDMIEFQIQIYLVPKQRGGDSASISNNTNATAEDGWQCLVDVRRMSGCPVAFSHYLQLLQRAIAAKCDDDITNTTTTMICQLPPVAPLYEDSTIVTRQTPSEDELVDKALSRAMMLMKEPACGTYLGLKYLSFLSGYDNDITRPNFPHRLARRLLTEGDGNHDVDSIEKAGYFRNLVESLLCEFVFLSSSNNLEDTYSSSSSTTQGETMITPKSSLHEKLTLGDDLLSPSTSGALGEKESKKKRSRANFHLRETRYLAIKLLTNMIVHFESSVNESDDDIQDRIERITKPWLLRRILPLLIGELNEAKDRPHEAYLVTKCLTAIMSSVPEVVAMCHHERLLDALQKASLVGQCSHPCLAQSTREIVTLLHV